MQKSLLFKLKNLRKCELGGGYEHHPSPLYKWEVACSLSLFFISHHLSHLGLVAFQNFLHSSRKGQLGVWVSEQVVFTRPAALAGNENYCRRNSFGLVYIAAQISNWNVNESGLLCRRCFTYMKIFCLRLMARFKKGRWGNTTGWEDTNYFVFPSEKS